MTPSESMLGADMDRVQRTALLVGVVGLAVCVIGIFVDRDQFFRIEEGTGVVDIDGVANRVEDDFAVIVPAGARHNVRNTGSAPLRLYTIYGPPEHLDGIVQSTKADADRRHPNEEWDGKTTE